jgi:hypothetical protein
MKNILTKITERLHLGYRINALRFFWRTLRGYTAQEMQQNMQWPTTLDTGNGNAATGQYQASGTATTIRWGTNNFLNITGFLTVTKISQKTIVAYEVPLENGDGLTAGLVLGIDGVETDIEVRDDTAQVTTALTVGQTLLIKDGGGLYPGGAVGATYTGIITGNGWDTAPKTPAGRTLTVKKFILIT